MSIGRFFKSLIGGEKSKASEEDSSSAAASSDVTNEDKETKNVVEETVKPEAVIESAPAPSAESDEGDGVAAGIDDLEEFSVEDIDALSEEYFDWETLAVFSGIGGYIGPVMTKDRVGVAGSRRSGPVASSRNSAGSRSSRGGAPDSKTKRGSAPTPREERGGAPKSKR